jgi:hypothetical protein
MPTSSRRWVLILLAAVAYKQTLGNSHLLEVRGDGQGVRLKDDWKAWLLPQQQPEQGETAAIENE